jgi:hypothetical protein
LTKDKPVLGAGCYEAGGKILSSVVGRPRRDGAVSQEILHASRSLKEGYVLIKDFRKGKLWGDNEVEWKIYTDVGRITANDRSLALLEKAIWVKLQISDPS